jgi:hypothetical protein
MSRILKIAVLIGISVFCGLVIWVNSAAIFWGWTEGNIKRSISTGDRLIANLYLFHERNGKFPNELTELIPDYIDSLPLPSAGGKQWEYSPREGNRFFLWFGMPRNSTWNGYPSCLFDSRKGKWYVDE